MPSENLYRELAEHILRGRNPSSGLDQVYPNERYDDGPTQAAQQRVVAPVNNAMMNAPMPVYPRPFAPQAEQGLAGGGTISPNMQSPPWYTRKESNAVTRAGMFKSHVPGRTDRLPIKVKSGSYVIPADIVSGLGEGNSQAGELILGQMFTKGPLGIKPVKSGVGSASRVGTTRLSKGAKIGLAEGGDVPQEQETEPVPVVVAGGEYLLEPEQVLSIGGGDMTKGHEILDNFVVHARKQLIKTLKGLRGPVKS